MDSGGTPDVCFCTEQVLKNGAKQGERNTFLGRIIVMLRGKGLPNTEIYRECIEWNSRCKPPKPKRVLKDEVSRYLEKMDQYKLNGCWWAIEDDHTANLVRKYCDVSQCPRANKKGNEESEEKLKVKISPKLVSDRRFKKESKMYLTPNELLVMTVLYKFCEPRKCFTVEDLKEKLLCKQDENYKLCMSDKAIKRTLEELQGHSCIELMEAPMDWEEKASFEDTEIKISRGMRFKEDEYIDFYYSAAEAFISNKIRGKDYQVYLCIIRNSQNGESCTEKNLGLTLGMKRENVSASIHRLEQEHCLEIIQSLSKSGNNYNWYIPVHTDEFHMEAPS